MKKLKLDLNATKLMYNCFKDSVKVRECYNNTFEVMSLINFTSRFDLSDYRVGYGFIKKNIGEEQVLFRHAFIIRNADDAVIDVTACLWKDVESKYEDYEYYIFKEYETMDEYTDALIEEDGMPALHKASHNEEIEVYNYLVKKGYSCNPIDHMDLLSRIYGNDIFDGINEYYSGNSVLYNPSPKLAEVSNEFSDIKNEA